MRRFLPVLIAATALLGACSRNLDANTYTSGNTVGKVVYGTVVSARSVTIKDHDKLEENALGGLAGGVVGGVAGSAAGKGTGKSLATVGGAIAGAVLGAYAQDELSTTSGYEYIVQLDSPGYNESAAKKNVTIKGQNSVAQDVKDSIHTAQTQSEAISIVQQDQAMLPAGTRVMVVYNDDRPRVIPVR